MPFGSAHWGLDRDGDEPEEVWAAADDVSVLPLLLHLSEDVAISARDHSLGLGAEGGEWMTEVTLLGTELGPWLLRSEGLSWSARLALEGDEVVGLEESGGSSAELVRSSGSFSSESLRRGSAVSLPRRVSSLLNRSQARSTGLRSL